MSTTRDTSSNNIGGTNSICRTCNFHLFVPRSMDVNVFSRCPRCFSYTVTPFPSAHPPQPPTPPPQAPHPEIVSSGGSVLQLIDLRPGINFGHDNINNLVDHMYPDNNGGGDTNNFVDDPNDDMCYDGDFDELIKYFQDGPNDVDSITNDFVISNFVPDNINNLVDDTYPDNDGDDDTNDFVNAPNDDMHYDDYLVEHLTFSDYANFNTDDFVDDPDDGMYDTTFDELINYFNNVVDWDTNDSPPSTSHPSFLDSLQSKIFSSTLPPVGSQCSICLEDFVAGNSSSTTVVVKELPCKHCFHRDCICQWLNQSRKGTCPMCRYKLPLDPNPRSHQ